MDSEPYTCDGISGGLGVLFFTSKRGGIELSMSRSNTTIGVLESCRGVITLTLRRRGRKDEMAQKSHREGSKGARARIAWRLPLVATRRQLLRSEARERTPATSLFLSLLVLNWFDQERPPVEEAPLNTRATTTAVTATAPLLIEPQ